MLSAGTRLELVPEKPAAGGRMIARHEGQVVLVAGAIPGERVGVRVDRVDRQVAYATVVDVIDPSPDRRPPATDPACGGAAFAHVAYGRQVELKRAILIDAFRRIGKLAIGDTLPVTPSPEQGYRMRARLHVRGHQVGFFREGTHELCDAAATGQLLPETGRALEGVAREIARVGAPGVRSIDLAENLTGDQRALHLELAPQGSPPPAVFSGLTRVDGVTGVTCQVPPSGAVSLGGRPWVADPVEALVGGAASSSIVKRRPNAFFQANRHLLPTLVSRVIARVRPGPVVDLYAGVGVFAVSLAALGWEKVTAVEGEHVAGADLEENAAPFAKRLRVAREAVESFLARGGAAGVETMLVDPPRTGMSRRAMDGVIAGAASRVVYVSCDVATLARDVRRLLDNGYGLIHLEAFDLFPNSAHVESLVVLDRTLA
jgi:23S rRNA (uracil1939-C5)-methyltransferase